MQQDYVPPEWQKDGFNCPHCGAFAHQRWQMRVDSFEKTSGDGECRFLPRISASVCARCSKFALWEDDRLVYPLMYIAPLPSSDMPEDVRQDYEEARSIFSYSPRGAAALLRLAIKKLVISLGETGSNLDRNIRNLIKKGLRADIHKALVGARVVGNNAASPGELSAEDSLATAHILFKLTNLIVEDMIAKPKEVSDLVNMLPNENESAAAKRNKNNKS